MDDTVQKATNQNQPAQDQPVVATDQTGVGSLHKEQGPSVPIETQFQAPEVKQDDAVTASEVEPGLHPEVKNAGVEILKAPQIPPDAQELGLEEVKEAVPVITTPTGKITLPMTEEEALQTLKTTKIKDSPHWFAALVKKAYQKLRQVIVAVKDN